MKISEVIKSSTADVVKFLDTAPRDELYTVQELSEKFGVCETTIKSSKLLKDYRIKYGDRKYYGSQIAISEFIRQEQDINED